MKFNLKGFIVANGATYWETDPYISSIDTAFSFNLVDPKVYKKYKELGCRNYIIESGRRLPEGCITLLNKMKLTLEYNDLYDLRANNILPLDKNAFVSDSKEKCSSKTALFETVRDMND